MLSRETGLEDGDGGAGRHEDPRQRHQGLRHTVATILREMGHDTRTIADMLAQKTIAMAEHYSHRANKTQKLTPVVESFDAEVNRRRTKLVKPA